MAQTLSQSEPKPAESGRRKNTFCSCAPPKLSRQSQKVSIKRLLYRTLVLSRRVSHSIIWWITIGHTLQLQTKTIEGNLQHEERNMFFSLPKTSKWARRAIQWDENPCQYWQVAQQHLFQDVDLGVVYSTWNCQVNTNHEVTSASNACTKHWETGQQQHCQTHTPISCHLYQPCKRISVLAISWGGFSFTFLSNAWENAAHRKLAWHFSPSLAWHA